MGSEVLLEFEDFRLRAEEWSETLSPKIVCIRNWMEE
jgi:hypothetical protein